MLSEAVLIDIDEVVARPAIVLGCFGSVLAPLAQPGHFLRQIDFLAAFGLDDPDPAVDGSHKKVRCVGGQLTVGFDVFDLEAHGHVVLAEGLHVGRVLQERCKAQFQAVGVGLADDAVEHRFFRLHIAARLGSERPGIAQADVPVDPRAAAFVDRQRVDRGAEVVEHHLPDFRLGQVAQDHRVFQIDGAGEEVVAEKSSDLGVELVVAADQAQIFEELSGEKRHHGAVIARPAAIQQQGVIDLAFEHGLEDDLAGFFRRKRLDRQLRVAEVLGLQLGQVLEFPVVASGQARHRDVEFVNVLVRRFGLNLDDQRILSGTSTGSTHRHTVEGDAFALDRLHEVHEGRRAHHRDGLALVTAEIHAAQAAPEGLLRQDVALRGIGAQADDGGDVAHVPAFLEHQH